MAYDRRRERVVIFGGEISLGSTYGDTWEWDGSAWESLCFFGSCDAPSNRNGFDMTYDALKGAKGVAFISHQLRAFEGAQPLSPQTSPRELSPGPRGPLGVFCSKVTVQWRFPPTLYEPHHQVAGLKYPTCPEAGAGSGAHKRGGVPEPWPGHALPPIGLIPQPAPRCRVAQKGGAS